MRTKILAELQKYKDEKYRIFHQKLVQPEIKVLGVRIPILHKMAHKILTQTDVEEYLNQSLSKLQYQEEFILYGLVISKLKETKENKIKRISRYVPYINNWAVCDIFCSDLKVIKSDVSYYYNYFLSYLQNNTEYENRFFYVIALNYFIRDDYLDNIFSLITKQKYCGYYDKMAVAWFISMAYIKYPEKTEKFLLEKVSERFVFQKSISKICDSLQVKKEAKIRLKKLASIRIKNITDK